MQVAIKNYSLFTKTRVKKKSIFGCFLKQKMLKRDDFLFDVLGRTVPFLCR